MTIRTSVVCGFVPSGHPPDRDVPVGQHPKRFAVVSADRQNADVQLAHSARGLLKRRLGRDALDAARHQFSHTHDSPPGLLSI
jgi:hypothetical protein